MPSHTTKPTAYSYVTLKAHSAEGPAMCKHLINGYTPKQMMLIKISNVNTLVCHGTTFHAPLPPSTAHKLLIIIIRILWSDILYVD